MRRRLPFSLLNGAAVTGTGQARGSSDLTVSPTRLPAFRKLDALAVLTGRLSRSPSSSAWRWSRALPGAAAQRVDGAGVMAAS